MSVMRCPSMQDQRERDAAMAAFKSGTKRVLVATDVAARGLDIKSAAEIGSAA